MFGVWYAVILHLGWVVALLIDQRAMRATAVSGPAQLFPNRYGLALLLLVVAGSAVAGIFQPLRISKVILLIPQQVMLGMSSAAALHAMIAGHFADGVPRPSMFLFADQLPAVIALVVHSLSIVYTASLMNGWLSKQHAHY